MSDNNKRRKFFQKDCLRPEHKAFRVISGMLILCQILLMIQPAFASEASAVCGLEEHKHNEECEIDGIQSCGLEEHTHSEICYSIPFSEIDNQNEENESEESQGGTTQVDQSGNMNDEQPDSAGENQTGKSDGVQDIETDASNQGGNEENPSEATSDSSEKVLTDNTDSSKDVIFAEEKQGTEALQSVMALSGDVVATGFCGAEGENVQYTITKNENYTDEIPYYDLTFTGTGEMLDYTYETAAPWEDYQDSIVKIEFEEGITYIGTCAFSGSRVRNIYFNVRELKFPSTLERIGESAFQEFKGQVKVLDLSMTALTRLEPHVFDSGEYYEIIKLPDTLEYIGERAFAYCLNLEELDLSNTNVKIIDSYTKGNFYWGAFLGCRKLKSVKWPQSLERIEDSAFYDCSSLERIEGLPDTLKYIGDYAFSGQSMNYSLTTVDLSGAENLTEIGEQAFSFITRQGYRSAISVIKLPDSVQRIGPYAFAGAEEVTEVSMPSALESLGTGAFMSCPKLNVTNNPSASLTTIGEGAFEDCEAMTSFDLTETGVTRIEANTFQGCKKLGDIGQPKASFIGESAFEGCTDLLKIDLSQSSEPAVISARAFYNCKSAEEIILPPQVTEIGEQAFSHCSAIKKPVTLPAALQMIGEQTFYHSGQLDFRVSLDSLIEVGSMIVSRTALSDRFEIQAPESGLLNVDDGFLEMVNDGKGKVFFNGGPYKAEFVQQEGAASVVTVQPLNTLTGWAYVDVQGAVYLLDEDAETAALAYLPPELETYTVPQSITWEETEYQITNVRSWALDRAEGLERMAFEAPASVRLEDYALANCPTLAEVNGKTDAASAEEIFLSAGIGAFINTGLTGNTSDIIFPGNLESAQRLAPDTASVIKASDLDSDTTNQAQISLEILTKPVPNTVTENILTTGTGNTVKLRVSISGADTDKYGYRYYFIAPEGDLDLSLLGMRLGETYTYEDSQTKTKIFYRLVLDDAAQRRYYVQFTTDSPGATISRDFIFRYRSPESDGGRLLSWIVMYPQEQELTEAVYRDYFELHWETERVPYQFSVSRYGSSELQRTEEGEPAYFRYDVSGDITLEQQKRDTYQSDTSLGRDNTTGAEYELTFQLPKGMSWSQEIVDGVKDGRVTIKEAGNYYVGERQIISFSTSSSDKVDFSASRVALDEAGQLVFYLRQWPTDNDGDLPASGKTKSKFSIKIPKENLEVGEEYDINTEQSIDLYGKAVVGYTYTEPDVLEVNEKFYVIQTGEPSLTLEKKHIYTPDIRSGVTGFELTLENTSLYDTRGSGIRDTLQSSLLCIHPEDMENLFFRDEYNGETYDNGEYSRYLRLTVSHVRLYDTPNLGSAVATDGETTVQLQPVTSDGSGYSDEHTIVLTKGERADTLSLVLDENEAVELAKGTLSAYLKQIGYAVIKETGFDVNWDFGWTEFPSGRHLSLYLPCNYKSTFQTLTADHLMFFNAESGDDTSWFLRLERREKMENTAVSRYGEASESAKTLTDSPYPAAKVCNDYLIAKEQRIDGIKVEALVEEGKKLEDNSVFDYTVMTTYMGNEQEDISGLPLVDVLSGAQVLMVPMVLENTRQSWASDSARPLETYKYDEKWYYLLDLKEGEESYIYENVWIGADSESKLYCADQVVVTRDGKLSNPSKYCHTSLELGTDGSGPSNDSVIPGNMVIQDGYTTEIKWYLNGSNVTIPYKAFCSSRYSGKVGKDSQGAFWMNSIVYLGDQDDNRLMFPTGTYPVYTIQGDKVILDNKGEVDDDDLSVVTAGETVHYRLSVKNTLSVENTFIDTRQIWDELPDTYGLFAWEKGKNISLRYETLSGKTENVWFDWEIVQDKTSGKYSIRWPAGVTVGGRDELHIYVDLTFPDNQEQTESGMPLWSAYCEENGSRRPSNTFTVNSYTCPVNHILSAPVKAFLQKGVYSIETREEAQSGYNDRFVRRTGNCLEYSSNTGNEQTVTYYVTVYNEGALPLYLTEIQDRYEVDNVIKSVTLGLPEDSQREDKDERWYWEWYDSNTQEWKRYTSIFTNMSGRERTILEGVTIEGVAPDKVTFVGADVVAKNSLKDGFRFTVEPLSGKFGDSEQLSKDITPISYDPDLELCYLEPGQAIAFAYICVIGNRSSKEDSQQIKNTVAMPYLDMTGAGVTASEISAKNVRPGVAEANDGECLVWSSAQAAEKQFTVEENKAYSDAGQWLVSDVTIHRAEIQPGIKKTTYRKMSLDGQTEEYPGVASTTDKVSWKLDLINGGDSAIWGYTVTDTLPAPYTFIGDVTRTVYNEDGTQYSEGYWGISKADSRLFTITGYEREDSTDTSSRVKAVTVETSSDVTKEETSYTVTVGGEPVPIPLLDKERDYSFYPLYTVNLSFKYDANNNLQIIMEFRQYTEQTGERNREAYIPAGGHAEIELWGENTTNTVSYSTYVNTAVFTPAQEYDNGNVVFGTCIYDENGKNAGIQARAPITTSDGHVTTSLKRVTEIENPENTAASYEDNAYIVLSENEESGYSKVQYTLEVGTAVEEDKGIQWVNLIDNLPEEGDHTTFHTDVQRYSAFQVNFAEEPEVTVKIKAKDGTESSLSPDAYTVSYSEKTEFSSADWNGEGDGWTENPSENARSIRILLKKTDGTALMPGGSRILVTFEAVVDTTSNPQPGEIAWNGFGYRYQASTSQITQESAPLEVGVKIPDVPRIEKRLTDREGSPLVAETNETFRFLIYQGEALKDKFSDETALAEALESDGRKAVYEEITVTSGTSGSEALRLSNRNVWEYSEGQWIETEERWNWIDGEKYTVTELGSYEEYDFNSWNGNTGSSYTFIQSSTASMMLRCENRQAQRALEIVKVDASDSDKRLGGAVFALYSEAAADQMTAEAYAANQLILELSEEERPEMTVTADVDGAQNTFYLYAVASSNALGQIQWSGLTRKVYYVTELRAPENFKIEGFVPQVIRFTYDDETGTYTRQLQMTAENTRSFVLPETGGNRASWELSVQLCFALGAAAIFLLRKRRSRGTGEI